MDEVIMDLGAKKKSFKCNEWEQEFQRSNDLKNHLKRDHKKPKELPKLHSGRTTHYNCPECNKPLPSAREVKLHLDKEHKKTQAFLGGNEDLDLSVTRKKPTASKPTANKQTTASHPQEQKRIVIFKVAGKLYWPAMVVSEDGTTITARVFNKRSCIKTVPKAKCEDFDYESHKVYISQNNSEHRHAFNEAKKLNDA